MTVRFTLACLLFLAAARIHAGQPNVLFIVCDDLNTHVSPSGYASTSTPTLDYLASSGMTFPNAYCQYPVCGPSRASFLNGLYPESTGVLNNTADIRQTRPGTVSMPQLFKESGYWTGSVGKVFHSPRHEHGEIAWDEFLRFENDELPIVTRARMQFEKQYGSVSKKENQRLWKQRRKEVAAKLDSQTPPGFGPSLLADQQHKDGKNVRQVTKWLRERPFADKPFFIALGIQKPHVPFLAPSRYFEQYQVELLHYEPDSPDLWSTLPRDAMSQRYKAFGFTLGEENDALRRQYMQAYHACISFIDTQLSMVISALQDGQYWEDTIIVFTSDHGYHLGEHFMWGKVTLFDVGTRVPMIVRVPGSQHEGTRSSAMVELIDIYPTLAELAGLEPPEDLQGTSLVPALEDPNERGAKDFAYTVVARRDHLGHAIRNQNWRYTRWPTGEELYDLRADPGEKQNLASSDDYAKQKARLRKSLKAIEANASTARERR